MQEIERELKEELERRGMKAEVKGREKKPHSIWGKMERKAIAFEQLSDLYGFRVIVDGVEDCYRTLGIVHTKWPLVPGRFKDYISTPKPNDYRSLHTTVIGPRRQRVELQVRTRDMDEIAEYGIAAHALYKDASGAPGAMLSTESSAYAWLRKTIENLSQGLSPEEFLEHTKLELFHDQVFCFTPKGRLIALPRKATPIDFAYAVHTDVGNTAVGCKINGNIAPLVSELKNGDEVEIITSKAQTPPRLGDHRRYRQGARRRAPRHAGGGAGAICRPRPQDRRAGLRPRRQGLLRRGGDQGHVAPCPHGGGRRVRGGRARRDQNRRSHPRRLSGLDRPAPRGPARRQPRPSGRGLVRAQEGAQPQVQDPRRRRRGLRGRPAHPGHQFRFARALLAAGGRGAGRPHRGHPHPGEGITIYPIQSKALQHFEDAPERWLDVRWDVDELSTGRFPRAFV